MRHYRAEHPTQPAQHSSLIARVDKQYLYESDLEALGVLPADAADREVCISQYAEEWACKQLLIIEGTRDYAYSRQLPIEIEHRVSAYKNELLAYYFLEVLAKRAFNDKVLAEEIEDYYLKHKHNDFMLNHDIVKGIFLVIPKRAVGINTVKSLMLSPRSSDRKKLEAYCKLYAHTAILEADRWFAWEDVLAKTGYPLGNNDPTRLLKAYKFIHRPDRKYVYFFKIDQYKLAEEKVIAPLEVVAERVQAIILHKRKLELIKEIKNNLLQKAKKNHTCVIHVHHAE